MLQNTFQMTSLFVVVELMNTGKILSKKLMDAWDNETNEERLELDLMIKMLGNSFMKGLKKGNEEGMKNYTLAGQRAEKDILKQFFKTHTDCVPNKDTVKQYALYHPGLVGRRDSLGVKTSADGILVKPHQDCGFESIPLECKARVSKGTFHRQMKRFQDVRDGRRDHGSFESNESPVWESIERDKKFLWTMFFDDKHRPHPNLHRLVPETSELMQCLHHAYTYGKQKCILVIGDHRSYLGSVVMYYPQELLDAYGRILKFSFDKTFAWAYKDGSEIPEVPDLVWRAFDSKQLKKIKMTKHAFYCFFVSGE